MMQYKQPEVAESYGELAQIPGLDVTVDKFNNRLVIWEQDIINLWQSIEDIRKLAEKIPWLGKIIVFCTENYWKEFIASGYRLEGYMEGFINGAPAVVVSKFLQQERAVPKDFLQEDRVLEKIFAKNSSSTKRQLGADYIIRTPVFEDIPQMAELYNKVFILYPTPVKNPSHLRACMQKNYLYKVIEHKGEIVSAASAEINYYYKAAEITDCVTKEEYRGQGLMYHLVGALEEEMMRSKLKTLFSLARAKSFGVNSVFHQSGYSYRGRLINNCKICSGFEDMNIWEKEIWAL